MSNSKSAFYLTVSKTIFACAMVGLMLAAAARA